MARSSHLIHRLRVDRRSEKAANMRLITWGIGGALALGTTLAHAGQNTEREADHDSIAANDEEPIGEVSQAATPAGTACRVTCATSYAAVCLQVQRICAVSTVVTIGSTAVPCATAIAVTCLTATAVAVVCADRCPP